MWQALGAHVTECDGVAGTHFAVWAPNAARVSVVGDFNAWDGRVHAMRRVGETGVWEVFLPGPGAGSLYKYEIAPRDGAPILKADPIGFGAQHPPETASVVRDIGGYAWGDDAWMQTRAARNRRDAPIAVYEVHLGSWRRRTGEGNRPLGYHELADELVAYATDMGFTHLEFLPVSEFPFDGSWGYQPVGMYAPTIRFGPPDAFRALIEAAHAAGLGVSLDWVPWPFPVRIPHGLALSRRQRIFYVNMPIRARAYSPGLEHADLHYRPREVKKLPDVQRICIGCKNTMCSTGLRVCAV